MRLSGRAVRLLGIFGVVAAVAVIVWALAAAPGRPVAKAGLLPAAVVTGGKGAGTTAGADISGHGAIGSGVMTAPPLPCCTAQYAPGLTVSGQAAARGTGSAATASAVAMAVADAVNQAKAAAKAAGISLGPIIGMQVSSSYPYPVPMGAGPARPGSVAGSPGASSPGSAGSPPVLCPAEAPCYGYPGRASATVTITWALAR